MAVATDDGFGVKIGTFDLIEIVRKTKRRASASGKAASDWRKLVLIV